VQFFVLKYTRFGATLFLGKSFVWWMLSKNVLGYILGDFLLTHLATLVVLSKQPLPSSGSHWLT
jgi:hypothetical protein